MTPIAVRPTNEEGTAMFKMTVSGNRCSQLLELYHTKAGSVCVLKSRK